MDTLVKISVFILDLSLVYSTLLPVFSTVVLPSSARNTLNPMFFGLLLACPNKEHLEHGSLRHEVLGAQHRRPTYRL